MSASPIKPTATPAEATARQIAPHQLILACALLLTAVAYLGAVRFPFVYDDLLQIVRNPLIRDWSSVATFFTRHVWAFVFPNWPGNYYRPVFLLWLLINHSLFGLNVVGWHLTSLAMHLLATFMVYRLGARLTADANTGAIAALLFGLHPVHLESVAWVSGVGDPILAVCSIGCFLAYLKARSQDQGRLRWTLISVLACAVALFDKETALALPPLIFASAWMLSRDRSQSTTDRLRAATGAVLPSVAVTLLYLWARTHALTGLAHRDSKTDAATLLLSLPSLVWFYARQLIAPIRTSLFYDVDFVRYPTMGNFYLPLLAAGGLLLALALAARRSRTVAIAALWIIFPLAPALAATAYFVRGELVHDRYLYVPSIGFCILFGMLLSRMRPTVLRNAVVALVALLALISTMTQSLNWGSNLLLYTRAIEVAPNNSQARGYLASELMDRGDAASAFRLYREAQQIAPEAWEPNFNLGYMYLRVGRFEEAERYLRQAIAIAPGNPDQYYFLTAALLRSGKLDEAEALARSSIQRWPQTRGFHHALSLIMLKKERLPEAHDALVEELRIAPDDEEARRELSRLDAQLADQPR